MNDERKKIVPVPLRLGEVFPALILFAGVTLYGVASIRREPFQPWASAWIIGSAVGFAVIAWRFLSPEAFVKDGTLTADSEGLRLGNELFRWQDIDRFGIFNDFSVLSLLTGRRYVYWIYRRPSSSSSGSDREIGINSLRYKLSATELAAALNDWMRQNSDRTTIVIDGPTLPKQRSAQRFNLYGYVILLSMLALWLFLRIEYP